MRPMGSLPHHPQYCRVCVFSWQMQAVGSHNLQWWGCKSRLTLCLCNRLSRQVPGDVFHRVSLRLLLSHPFLVILLKASTWEKGNASFPCLVVTCSFLGPLSELLELELP